MMMPRQTDFSSFMRRAFRCEHGVAAIEFAMITPLLLMMAIATVDLGMGFYRKMQVQNAAEAGVTYASFHGFQVVPVTRAITTATKFAVQAQPAPAQFCGCAATAGIITIDCTKQCTGNITPGTYVRTSARATYQPIFPYPFLPDPVILQAAAILRLR